MKMQEKKKTGILGEKIATKYLNDHGFYAERGYWKDIKVWRQEPSSNRSRVSNHITCEVKTTETQEHVHRPRENQKESNELLALVKILENDKLGGVRFKIRFEILDRSVPAVFERELPVGEWDEIN